MQQMLSRRKQQQLWKALEDCFVRNYAKLGTNKTTARTILVAPLDKGTSGTNDNFHHRQNLSVLQERQQTCSPIDVNTADIHLKVLILILDIYLHVLNDVHTSSHRSVW